MANFKTQIMRDAVKIQTKFNRDISDGWNIMLSGKDSIIEFIVLIDDGTKLIGTMSEAGNDVQIEWESEQNMSFEGLTFGENVIHALTELVALTKIEQNEIKNSKII